MTLVWFVPVAILIGLAGTQTTLRVKHYLKVRRKEKAWWLLILIAWLPLLCWLASQFVTQG